MKKTMILFLVLALMLSMVACGGSKSVVGKWARTGRDSIAFIFYENGDYESHNSDFGGRSFSKFELLSDGTLLLKSSLGDLLRTFEKTNSKEPGEYEYYIKGDILIVGDYDETTEYERLR